MRILSISHSLLNLNNVLGPVMKISSFNYQVLRSVIICSCALIARCLESENVEKNVPKEILDLFNKINDTRVVKNGTFPAGSVGNGNKIFAEGSSISLKEQSNQTFDDAISKINGVTPSPTTETAFGSKSVKVTKLDFLASSEESSNSNRTSSIKPRKGVRLSKIVPKKGVNFEDFINSSLPVDHSCFVVNLTHCYDVDYYRSVVCTCCPVSNKLGRMISHQPLTNCSNCTPVNKLPLDLSEPCLGVCCENITFSTTVRSPTDKRNITTSKDSKDYKHFEYDDGSLSKLQGELNGTNHITKKLKPNVTNVPYDSDVRNAFSKSKGEKYLPIIVSIFVLPLAGLLIFFTWKKTREIWDRRYYRRMDFLIDGIYNE